MKIKTLFTAAIIAIPVMSYALTPSQEAAQEASAAAADASQAVQIEHHGDRITKHLPFDGDWNADEYAQDHIPIENINDGGATLRDARHYERLVLGDLSISANVPPSSIHLTQIYGTPKGYGYQFNIRNVGCVYRELVTYPKTRNHTVYYAKCSNHYT